jgi:hypothetical protein
MSRKKNKGRLEYWQDKIRYDENAWDAQRKKMDHREAVYRGCRELEKLVERDAITETSHVYNITAENIESIVDSTIYQPKVTPLHQEDEQLALMIEHMISNELDRLPMEEINDMMERTCPIQGGGLYWPEWDETAVIGNRKGAIKLTYLHPKQLIPQDGIFTSIDDMDHVALKLSQTWETIKRKYGVDVRGEAEQDPEIKGATGESMDSTEGLVTQYVVFYRNEQGGIGRYSWCNDTELEDLEDYQSRRLQRCAKCGAAKGSGSLILDRPTVDGTFPEGDPPRKAKQDECPYCGSTKWEDSEEDYEELYIPVPVQGQMLGGAELSVDEFGNTVAMAAAHVPFFKPGCFPLILQKNVSVYGQLLGESDVDSIQDQQNTINRLEQKIIDRLMKAGSRVSLPPETSVTIDPQDGEVWRLKNVSDREYIGVYNFSGDLHYEMAYLTQVYQESRNRLGVTDSYQGRKDPSATSGKAKQFSAQMAAGRMESKRVMKRFAYSKLFEAIFKLMLAYCDDRRPVIWKDAEGTANYEEFNRYDFLRQDERGDWYWNTDFLFSVDDSGGLAQNRSAMWNELTTQLNAGALGNPAELDTLIAYWRAMEEMHYPGAGKRMRELAERKKQTQEAQMAAAQIMPPMPVQ